MDEEDASKPPTADGSRYERLKNGKNEWVKKAAAKSGCSTQQDGHLRNTARGTGRNQTRSTLELIS
jgi:hypothetical protein